MLLRRRILQAIGWLAVSRFATQLVTWIVTLAVIRVLTPEDYGLMAITSAFLGFFIALTSVGLAGPVQQSANVTLVTLRQIHGINLCVSALLMVVVSLGAYPIAALYGDERLVPLIQVASLNLLLMSFFLIPKVLIQKQLAQKRVVAVEVFSTLVYSLTVLVFAYSGFGVWALVIGLLVGNFINMVGYNIVEPFLKIPLFSMNMDARRLVQFGSMRTLEQIAWYIYDSFDIFIIGKLVGSQSVGYYNVARTLAMLPVNKIAPIFNPIAFSAFSLVQDRRPEAGGYFLKLIKLLSLLSFPIFFGLSSVAPLLVSLFLGEKWSDVALPMQILAIAASFKMIGLVVGPFLQGIGEFRLSLSNALFGLVLIPAAISIGCYWGVVGASLGGAISAPLYLLHIIWRAAPVSGIGVEKVLGNIVKPLFSAVIMFLVVWSASAELIRFLPDYVALLVAIILGVLTYGTLVYIIQKNDVRELLSLLTSNAQQKPISDPPSKGRLAT